MEEWEMEVDLEGVQSSWRESLSSSVGEELGVSSSHI